MDLDEILSRAETQATSDDTSHSDLLSQFKVASFAMEEDEPAPPPTATPTEGKTFLLSPRGSGQVKVERSWEELIPEDARKRADEEERTREQLELYLPPRQRKVQVLDGIRVHGCVVGATQRGSEFRQRGSEFRGQSLRVIG